MNVFHIAWPPTQTTISELSSNALESLKTARNALFDKFNATEHQEDPGSPITHAIKLSDASGECQRVRWTLELMAKVYTPSRAVQEASSTYAGKMLSESNAILSGADFTPDRKLAWIQVLRSLSAFLRSSSNLGESETSGAGHPLASGTRLAVQQWLHTSRMYCACRPEDDAELQRVNSQLQLLESEFCATVNGDESHVWLTEEELEGVPSSITESMLRDTSSSPSRVRVTMKYPDALPVLRLALREKTRETVYRCFRGRASGNTERLLQVARLRQQRAALLGLPSHADLIVDNERLVGSPQRATEFLEELGTKFTQLATEERAALQLEKNKRRNPGETENDAVQLWDVSFLTELYQQREFGLSDEAIREFFPLRHVRDIVFELYSQLFGIIIEPATSKVAGSSGIDLSPAGESSTDAVIVWHESVSAFRVFGRCEDESSSAREFLGTCLLDLFPRDGKYSHACAFPVIDRVDPSALVDASQPGGRLVDGVACMVANFPMDTATRPSCLNHREVVTFFHEFGHVIHNLCARASTESETWFHSAFDFIEAPSQMLENWAWDPAVLRRLGKHYGTSSQLDESTISNLIRSKNCMIALANERQVGMSLFDLKMHSSPSSEFWQEIATGEDLCAALETFMTRGTGFEPLQGGKFACAFMHMCSGYDSSYYTYLWSEMISCDLFESFGSQNCWDARRGREYRRALLDPGASRPSAELIREFLGRDPSSDALLRSCGISLNQLSTPGLAEVDAAAVGGIDSCGNFVLVSPTSTPTRNQIFLGSRKVVESVDALRHLRIQAVVNCAPTQVPKAEGISSECYFECTQLSDAMSARSDGTFGHHDVRPFFKPVAEFVSSQLRAGRNVLVHCAGGVSRSGCLVLATLLQLCANGENRTTLRNVWTQVKELRSVIAPNASFVHALIDLERELTGSETVVRPLSIHQRAFKFVEQS